MTSRLCPLALLAALAAPVAAQVPPRPLPARGPAPLLFVRFAGRPGLRVTLYQGRTTGRSFDAPVVVGLRPGYVYRVELSSLAQLPGYSLYPTLQVVDALRLNPKLSSSAYPVTVTLTDADVASAVAGSLVTKVLYLENPERAAPVPQAPGEVPELPVPPGRDLLAEARDLGRPVLIVRLGQRLLSREELARESVYGTILHPGERVLPPASRPPCVPPAGRDFFDPYLGPRPPEEECLRDGGDRGPRAGLDGEGRLQGVDPEDTVAEYTDDRGRRRVVCSNRVCVCVPRFAALRTELPLGQYDTVVAPGGARLVKGQQQVLLRQPSVTTQQAEVPLGARGRLRPSANFNVQAPALLERVEVLEAQQIEVGPIALLGTPGIAVLTEVERVRLARQVAFAREFDRVQGVQGTAQVVGTAVVARVEGGPQVIRAEAETRDLTVCCPEAVPAPPSKPLMLVKCADRHAAQVGDVVTFTLRYSNQGGRPLTDIAVTDSLTARLEYVPGSARADRNAVFTVQENEAGSLTLRWEITGRLLPGQGGVLRFQARVR